MPLVTSTEMFKKAYAGGYAIGAFNVNNMEMIQAIVEAANEEKAPVILQVSAGARKYANPVYLKHLVEAAVETTDIPIVMHLDHGADFDICKASIDGGFTSVMIDASSKPWEENIAITKKVVEYAHDHGVVVEAELGKLAGVEDDVHVAADDALFTSPDEVEEFTSRTGIDSLAIAIGTSHGAFVARGVLFNVAGTDFGCGHHCQFGIRVYLRGVYADFAVPRVAAENDYVSAGNVRHFAAQKSLHGRGVPRNE